MLMMGMAIPFGAWRIIGRRLCQSDGQLMLRLTLEDILQAEPVGAEQFVTPAAEI